MGAWSVLYRELAIPPSFCSVFLTNTPFEYPLWGMTPPLLAGIMLSNASTFQLGSDGEIHLMTDGREFDKQAIYQIRVKGNLDRKWSDWFDDFTITPQANGETLMTGPVADQSALHGLLAKIRDLGLPLLSVKRLER